MKKLNKAIQFSKMIFWAALSFLIDGLRYVWSFRSWAFSVGIGWITSLAVITISWFSIALLIVVRDKVDPIQATLTVGTIMYPLSVLLTLFFTYLWENRTR